MILKYAIVFFLIPIISRSQVILRNSGHSYYDCHGFNINATYLMSEKFDLRWDSSDIPNGPNGSPTHKYAWNTLEKQYYCDCESSAKGFPPKLKSEAYYRNGLKNGIWTTYFLNGQKQSIAYYIKDSLVWKKRYTIDRKDFAGKFEAKEWNTVLGKEVLTFSEVYSKGRLISGVYYDYEVDIKDLNHYIPPVIHTYKFKRVKN